MWLPEFNIWPAVNELISLFLWISDIMWMFSMDYADHWILGFLVTYVTQPLSDRFWEFAIWINELAIKYSNLANTIGELLEGTLLGDLLITLWDRWSEFTEDPVYFIIQAISEYWPDFYWFVQDPQFMITYWLGSLWTDIQELFERGSDWVLEQLDIAWPDFYWFRQDPGYMMEYWLLEQHPDFEYLLTDPRKWIKTMIAQVLGISEPELDDPWGWFLGMFLTNIGPWRPDTLSIINKLCERVLRYFWEGAWPIDR